MNENQNTPAAPAAQAKPAAPAPAKRARRTGGTLASRYESLIQPQLVPTGDLPDALGTIRTALEAAGESDLSAELFGKEVPAGILGPQPLLDLNKVAEALGELIAEVK